MREMLATAAASALDWLGPIAVALMVILIGARRLSRTTVSSPRPLHLRLKCCREAVLIPVRTWNLP